MENSERSYYIIDWFDLDVYDPITNERKKVREIIGYSREYYRNRYGFSLKYRCRSKMYIYYQNGFVYEFFSNELLGEVNIKNIPEFCCDDNENYLNLEISLGGEFDLKFIAENPSTNINEFKKCVDNYVYRKSQTRNYSLSFIRKLILLVNEDMEQYIIRQEKYQKVNQRKLKNDKDFLDNFHKK